MLQNVVRQETTRIHVLEYLLRVFKTLKKSNIEIFLHNGMLGLSIDDRNPRTILRFENAKKRKNIKKNNSRIGSERWAPK